MFNKLKIKSIKKIDKKIKVYDIEVENDHHYILKNGIISHNSGGQGTKYAASITLFLSSRKQKSGDEVVGRIIRCTLKKGRLTKQDKQVEIALDFEKGLNRYYGLLAIGLEQEIFTKEDKKINLGFGIVASESEIYANPTKYFTPRVMEKLEVAAGNEFLYGSRKQTDAAEEVAELAAAVEVE